LKSHLKRPGTIIGVDLSSYGGDFDDGIRIANLARRPKLTVYVSDECDSACVDIFFAATKRYFGTDTKIGVHSISNERAVEDATTRLITMELARLWAKRGIPNSAISKMLTTRPDAIAYLDRTDLADLDAATGNPFVRGSGQPGEKRQGDCARQLNAGDRRNLFTASAAGAAKTSFRNEH